jgi:hypothetical protein
VLATVLWLLDSVHGVAIAASTVFVLSRIVHAGIHLSINALPPRRHLFTVGWVAVFRDGGAGALGVDAPRGRLGADMIARNQIFWPVIVQMLLTMLVFVRPHQCERCAS